MPRLPTIELVGGPRCGEVATSPTPTPPPLLRFVHAGEVCQYVESPYYAEAPGAGRVDFVYQFRGHGR